jgi:hypothetical protein
MQNLSTGQKAGVGVAIGVGALAIIGGAIGIGVYEHNKHKKAEEENQRKLAAEKAAEEARLEQLQASERAAEEAKIEAQHQAEEARIDAVHAKEAQRQVEQAALLQAEHDRLAVAEAQANGAAQQQQLAKERAVLEEQKAKLVQEHEKVRSEKYFIPILQLTNICSS